MGNTSSTNPSTKAGVEPEPKSKPKPKPTAGATSDSKVATGGKAHASGAKKANVKGARKGVAGPSVGPKNASGPGKQSIPRSLSSADADADAAARSGTRAGATDRGGKGAKAKNPKPGASSSGHGKSKSTSLVSEDLHPNPRVQQFYKQKQAALGIAPAGGVGANAAPSEGSATGQAFQAAQPPPPPTLPLPNPLPKPVFSVPHLSWPWGGLDDLTSTDAALMKAAFNLNKANIGSAFGKRASPGVSDRKGLTPVMAACRRAKTPDIGTLGAAVVRLLIKWGCPTTSADHAGRTALHYIAIKTVSPELIGALLVDPCAQDTKFLSAKDSTGKTAADYAIIKGNTAVAEELERTMELIRKNEHEAQLAAIAAAEAQAAREAAQRTKAQQKALRSAALMNLQLNQQAPLKGQRGGSVTLTWAVNAPASAVRLGLCVAVTRERLEERGVEIPSEERETDTSFVPVKRGAEHVAVFDDCLPDTTYSFSCAFTFVDGETAPPCASTGPIVCDSPFGAWFKTANLPESTPALLWKLIDLIESPDFGGSVHMDVKDFIKYVQEPDIMISLGIPRVVAGKIWDAIAEQKLALTASPSTQGTFFGEPATATPGPDAHTPAPSHGFSTAVTPFRHIAHTRLKPVHTIGSGHFGTVQLCKEADSGALVAVKSVNSYVGGGGSLVREIQNLERVPNHPFLVEVLGVCFDHPDRTARLVLEYCELGSLAKFSRLHPETMTWPMVQSALAQVAGGIAFLHSLSPPVIHRDIRADNVLVSSRHPFKLKVTDFGLSHAILDVAVVESGTVTTVGPTAWMAPETLVAKAKRSQDFATESAGSVDKDATGGDAGDGAEAGGSDDEQGDLASEGSDSDEDGSASAGTPSAGAGGDGDAREAEAVPTTAPRQVVSPSTDVYMFGGMMFELLTGETPFEWLSSRGCLELRRKEPTLTALAAFRAHRGYRARDPSQWLPCRASGELDVEPVVIAGLEQLMNDCWNPDPKLRPSMSEVASKLRRMAEVPLFTDGGYADDIVLPPDLGK